MSSLWPLVPLGEILHLQRRWIKLHPTETYREIGIRSFGNGIFHKAPIQGSTLGNKRVLRIEPGDLVFNNVFAWEGAVAVAGPEEAGMIGSHRFVTYKVDLAKATAEFLQLFFRTKAGREIMLRASPGSAGRNKTLGLDRFMTHSVPLPPLTEQRWLVERVGTLITKVEKAKRIRCDAGTATTSIFPAAATFYWKSTAAWTTAKLGDLISTVCGQVDPREQPYAQLPHINGESIESGTGRLLHNYQTAEADGMTSGKYHFQPNAVLYSKIRPYLRKATVVPFEGVCSADIYAIDKIVPDLNPQFLVYSLIGPEFTKYANELSGRTRMPKLNQDQMFRYELRYPSLSEQEQIVNRLNDLLGRINLLKKEQANSDRELDAMLPAILDRAFRGEL